MSHTTALLIMCCTDLALYSFVLRLYDPVDWLHEQRENLKSFIPVKIDGPSNCSDMMTKPLPAITLQKFVKFLRLCDVNDFSDQ